MLFLVTCQSQSCTWGCRFLQVDVVFAHWLSGFLVLLHTDCRFIHTHWLSFFRRESCKLWPVTRSQTNAQVFLRGTCKVPMYEDKNNELHNHPFLPPLHARQLSNLKYNQQKFDLCTLLTSLVLSPVHSYVLYGRSVYGWRGPWNNAIWDVIQLHRVLAVARSNLTISDYC